MQFFSHSWISIWMWLIYQFYRKTVIFYQNLLSGWLAIFSGNELAKLSPGIWSNTLSNVFSLFEDKSSDWTGSDTWSSFVSMFTISWFSFSGKILSVDSGSSISLAFSSVLLNVCSTFAGEKSSSAVATKHFSIFFFSVRYKSIFSWKN